jgi:hypothetical protein
MNALLCLFVLLWFLKSVCDRHSSAQKNGGTRATPPLFDPSLENTFAAFWCVLVLHKRINTAFNSLYESSLRRIHDTSKNQTTAPSAAMARWLVMRAMRSSFLPPSVSLW